MRRRSRAGSKSVKERHRKAAVQKRPTAPKARARVAPVPDRETEVAKLTRERDEALEQLSEALERQTATSEVLRVIQLVVRYPRAGISGHVGERSPHLRGQVRLNVSIGGRGPSRCGARRFP
jgi:hypothetical protein